MERKYGYVFSRWFFAVLTIFVILSMSTICAEEVKYIVKQGDTLGKIAKTHYNDIFMYRCIAERNNIKDVNLIYEGQELILPSLSDCSQENKVFVGKRAETPPEIVSCDGQKNRICLLYFNDFHGALEPTEQTITTIKDGESIEKKLSVGGIARLAGLVNQIRWENDKKGIPTYLCASGDFIQGQFLSNEKQGAIEAEIMKKIGISFFTVGNHELDFGNQALVNFVATNINSCVTSNLQVDFLGEMKAVGKPRIVDIGSMKIGFAGLVDDEAFDIKTSKVDPIFLEKVRTQEKFEKAKEIVANLKKENVDFIVFLTHIGLENDIKLAKEIPSINIILGGDSHSKIEPFKRVGNTYIFQADSYGKYLGKLDLELVKNGICDLNSTLIPIVGEDQEVANLIKKYKDECENFYSEIVAESECLLDGERKNVRSRETNLGDLVTDFLRAHFKTDIALYNGGGIRASINKGVITKKDVYAALPFPNNNTEVLQIPGETLLEILNYDAKQIGKGGFLQVSGIEFTILKDVGVKDVRVNGVPLDPLKIYSVVTNSFLAHGGDGYTSFNKIPDGKPSREIYPNPTPLFVNYLKQKYGENKKISLCQTENRITIIED